MKKNIQILRKKFEKHEIDGYVIPKNDEYFTEYSKINRLHIISNFSGSAGLAIILKKKNYLFTDGRYTIQSQTESGRNFKIHRFEKLPSFRNRPAANEIIDPGRQPSWSPGSTHLCK